MGDWVDLLPATAIAVHGFRIHSRCPLTAGPRPVSTLAIRAIEIAGAIGAVVVHMRTLRPHRVGTSTIVAVLGVSSAVVASIITAPPTILRG